MEPKVEAMGKNPTSNIKGLFLFEQNHLKNFTIPKRTPDKDFLTEWDYSDIKQRLNQGCFDTEYNRKSLWHFDSIEMVHNKDLEEEFVAKRAKLREEGKQDKELSSFLVASKDEVTNICQSGLHTGHSTKKELNIMKKLGNPQLGVYLFRHVDIALNYASKHSVCVENIIIFRVLLGKVKKIQPPKGKKNVGLDPTPNFDCHMSRIHLSLKDSVEDKAVGSLVYFYEYNELLRPVDKPRQCLPYAVVKVKCVNLKMGDDSLVTSLMYTPKTCPADDGRQGLPLENWTRVTRIGKGQLIYEHFQKPEKGCAVNSDNSAAEEVYSFLGSKQNWEGPEAEIHGRKVKHNSTRRWELEASELSTQSTSGMDARRDTKSDHMKNRNKDFLEIYSGLSSVYATSSRLLEDPRLKKREQNIEEQNGERGFYGFSLCGNELECNSEIKIAAMVDIRHAPEEFSLCSDSTHAFRQKERMEKIAWEEITLKEGVSPSLLHIDENYLGNAKQGLGNVNKLKEEIIFPNKMNEKSVIYERLNEKCLPREHPNNCKDINNDINLEVGIELKSLDFMVKISEILQKADGTLSLNVLREQVIACRNSLPSFIRAFEEKQEDSFEQVLASREILEKNMWALHTVKPCAIESLVELQIVMETIEFIENKKRFIEGEPTFRSLLWFDGSLWSELFGEQSGYQQQSNFYPAFQRRLKYGALNELQNYHEQLMQVFDNTRWESNSYYSFLKLRREIQECEEVMRSHSDFSAFFLSVPFVCGANYGDTIEDLENSRKSAVDLLNASKSLAGSVEKENHLLVLIEIIATKIGFIRTCEEVNIKASLFGLEHIFFDAAKCLAWRSKDRFISGDLKGETEQILHLNEVALSKLCEIYGHMTEKLASKHISSAILRQCADEPCDYEKADRQREAYDDTTSLLLGQLNVGEIIDEAESANLDKLQQHLGRCTEHLEMLKKYFQILQEEDVVNILITKENVLGFMNTYGINAVILKPEAVEVYTEIAMLYETVSFLKNKIVRKLDKPTFRSLLWFDLSLLHELFQCQESLASFSYRKDNLLKMLESAISAIENELNVICEYAENLNYSYAKHLLSRELAELCETRNHLQSSKSNISLCVDSVPYTVAVNYGSTTSELEHNYNQFSLLLEKLTLANRKDLGKMAHVMKIMKTIEHMMVICTEQGKSPFNLVMYQMHRNWRKSCQSKRHLNTNKRHSTKHNVHVNSPVVSYSTAEVSAQKVQHERPAGVTSESTWDAKEGKNDPSHSKKKRVVPFNPLSLC